ncbi:hypothetical protein, partial [Azospirillum argentinense]
CAFPSRSVWLIIQGWAAAAPSKLLDHASKQMTLRYVHLAPDTLDGAIMALDTGAAPAPHV